MKELNKISNKNSRRNWAENEALIAEGILSLMRKGRSPEQIRNSEIAAEIGISPVEVHRHMAGDDFYSRNIRRISGEFIRRTANTSAASFPTVFLLCVKDHRCWFQIEFERQNYRLFKEIMTALESKITLEWAKQIGSKKPVLYQMFCHQVFLMLSNWFSDEFAGERIISMEAKLRTLLTVFTTGQINTIWTVILY